MTHMLLDPTDSLETQNAKLLTIAEALMGRVEQDTDRGGVAYAEFERAVLLGAEIRERTADLEHTMGLLNQSNGRLAEAKKEAERARALVTNAIEAIREGLALFDRDDRLILKNRRFAMPMADIYDRVTPGMSFPEYVALAASSRFLDLERGEKPRDWARRRIARHHERQVLFNVRLLGDRWLQISEYRTPDGGTAILQTDVTEMMRLERTERGKLLDSQARMVRATLDQINQGVCIFDKSARLLGWNRRLVELVTVPTALLRLGMRFDALQMHVREQFGMTEDSARAPINAWVRRSAPRQPISFEISNQAGVTLSVFARDMPDGGFVMCFTDVTAERDAARALFEANELLEQRVRERTLELQDAVARAERANASKSRFVAAASHDLLQPLSAAKLYIASISEGRGSDSDRAAAGKALGALTSVEGIIDALLDISKLESAQEFDIKTVPLDVLLRGLQDEFAPIAALKGLRFRVVPCNVHVTSDPGYLRRVLQNLIANAIRYTDAGTVLVGARRNGGSVRVEVWDTGCGIAEADQNRIFQEFTRLDGAATAAEGLGLGLAIVERACARLGHPLSLWSQPGRGSGFFVSLPMEAPQSQLTGRPTGPVPLDALPPGMVVLLVENDPELRLATSLLLEAWNIAVLDAANGAEAEALLEELQFTPDALLIDQHLGRPPDGVTLADRIMERHGLLPCRIVSADRSPALRAHCRDTGLRLLMKPLDASALYAFLREAGEHMRATTTLGL